MNKVFNITGDGNKSCSCLTSRSGNANDYENELYPIIKTTLTPNYHIDGSVTALA